MQNQKDSLHEMFNELAFVFTHYRQYVLTGESYEEVGPVPSFDEVKDTYQNDLFLQDRLVKLVNKLFGMAENEWKPGEAFFEVFIGLAFVFTQYKQFILAGGHLENIESVPSFDEVKATYDTDIFMNTVLGHVVLSLLGMLRKDWQPLVKQFYDGESIDWFGAGEKNLTLH